MKRNTELDTAGLKASVWELNCLSSFCKRASCLEACAEHLGLLAELILMCGEAGLQNPVEVERTALQLKNGCYDCYVCRIICCHSLLCSFSLGFSLSSNVKLRTNCLYAEAERIFAYGILSVQVSAKFLQNFLPLHSSSSKWGTSICLGTGLYA